MRIFWVAMELPIGTPESAHLRKGRADASGRPFDCCQRVLSVNSHFSERIPHFYPISGDPSPTGWIFWRVLFENAGDTPMQLLQNLLLQRTLNARLFFE